MAVKKCFSVVGYHNSGKTSLVEDIIKILKGRGVSVSAIKHAVHFDVGKGNGDSERFFVAGAKSVVALFDKGTQIYAPPVKLRSAFSYVDSDVLIVEGFKGEAIPNIVRAKMADDAKKLVNELTFATVIDDGGFVGEIPSFKPDDVEGIVDVAMERSFPPLPFLDCGHCKEGSCFKMAAAILKGRGTLQDCVVLTSSVRLKVNGINIPLSPFVEHVVKTVVTALVGTLKDTSPEIKEIDLHIKE